MMMVLYWILLIALGLFSFALSTYICFFKIKGEFTVFYRCVITLTLGLLVFALLFTAVMFIVWPPVI